MTVGERPPAGGRYTGKGALGILRQQPLALEAAAYTLTDQLNQILQLPFVRRFDALKTGRAVVAICVDAIQEQQMKVNIQEQPH